jgi:hypothetical protein
MEAPVSAALMVACATCASGKGSQLGALLPAMLLLPYVVGWFAYTLVRPLLRGVAR